MIPEGERGIAGFEKNLKYPETALDFSENNYYNNYVNEIMRVYAFFTKRNGDRRDFSVF